MVASLLHPLNIFIVGLGGAFLIPLAYRVAAGMDSQSSCCLRSRP